MRITGFYEDDEGNGRYLVEWSDEKGRKLTVHYSEAEGIAEKISADEASAFFESGDLEKCSFPASEVLFPDEIKELAERFENAVEEDV